MGSTLEAEAEQLGAESGVPIELHLSAGRGFDGADTAIAVLTVVVGAIGGGALSAVGGDVWSRIKGLLRRTREARYSCTVVLVRQVGDTEVRYRCEISSSEDLDAMIAALDSKHTAPAGAAGEPIVLRLDGDGVWKSVS